jgi:hypothetical protein
MVTQNKALQRGETFQKNTTSSARKRIKEKFLKCSPHHPFKDSIIESIFLA